MAVGTCDGVAVGEILMVDWGTSVASAVAFVLAETLVGLGLEVGGFVGSGLGGFCVGEGSISILTSTLSLRIGVSTVWFPPPQVIINTDITHTSASKLVCFIATCMSVSPVPV